MKEGHRDSDGWEDFEDMWRQNDASPRSAKRAPVTPTKTYRPNFDDNDSFDMSIVEGGRERLTCVYSPLITSSDTGPSPSTYVANLARQ